MLTSFLNAMRSYGGSLAIGAVLKNSAIIGIFHWGHTLAFQAIFLLAANLQNVFFPALAKLNREPARQEAAFRKTVRVLSVAGVIACVLQMLLAGPIIRELFNASWVRAVPVVQWLSLAILTQPLAMVSNSLLVAKGRFQLTAVLTGASGVAVTLGSVIGAQVGDERAIAQSTALSLMATNLLAAIYAYRSLGVRSKDIASDLAPAALVGIPTACVGLLSYTIAATWPVYLAAAATTLVTCFTACISAQLFCPKLVAEVTERAGEMLCVVRSRA
jgi:O-antigen/teichoic acid export membrane protein